MDPVAEIKNRIAIEDLVSQYVQLKKVGRNWKALCPFHNERTPSFYVSSEKQLAYCFGCRKGGDHFKFIEEIEGVDFKGALTMLAEKAGVELPKYMPRNSVPKSERDRLIEIHEQATKFFEERLHGSVDGKKALSYLKKRGVSEEMIRRTRLGFAPGAGDLLYAHLLKHDFTKTEILASGLALAREVDGSSCADRFRGRLIFPIQNLAGQVCAFGGRALAEGQEPKYLNSPETPIFHKSSTLYNLASARPEIRNQKTVILVEGYMDAVAVSQAGFANVVACGGTALTLEQLRLLKRFAKEVIFAFDCDTAGIAAAERAIQLSFEEEISIRVAVWKSDAKDPDECVRENPKLFAEAVKTAPPALEYLLSLFQKRFDIATANGKREMVDALMPFFSAIKSHVELDAWFARLSALLNLSLTSLYDELKRFRAKQKPSPRPLAAEPVNRDFRLKEIQVEEYLIGILLTFPESHSIVNQLIKPEDFTDIELQNIYRSLPNQYNQESLRSNAEPNPRANLLGMLVESKHADMNWDAVVEEIWCCAQTLLKQKFEREKRSLLTRLKELHGADSAELLDSYQKLLAQEEQLLSSHGKET